MALVLTCVILANIGGWADKHIVSQPTVSAPSLPYYELEATEVTPDR